MNMFKKSELEYKNGYIVKGDSIIAIDNEIVDLFNKLEEDVQRAKWAQMNKMEPASKPLPFIRKSEQGAVHPVVIPETPGLDAEALRTLKLMDEWDEIEAAQKINEYFDGIIPLFVFAKDEFVIDLDGWSPHRFDLPTLGNPLMINADDICAFVADMFTDKPIGLGYEQE